MSFSKKKKSAWKNKLVIDKISSLRSSKTLLKINKYTHQKYIKRFDIAAEKHKFSTKDLGLGRKAYFLGNGVVHLAIISGIHGEERAGPIALLKMLEKTRKGKLIPNNISLVIVPLIAFDAWNKQNRENGGINLNESWTKKFAPDYIHNLKNELTSFKPDIFLDFHEDSTIEDKEPYLFRRRGNKNIIFELQNAIDVCRKKGIWRKCIEHPGSSESFAHSIGCPETTTIETPQTEPLRSRVGFDLAILDWLFRKCGGQENKYKSLHAFWYTDKSDGDNQLEMNFLKIRYNTRKTNEEQAILRMADRMRIKNVENYTIFDF